MTPPSFASSPSSILSVSRQRTSPIWRYCRVEDGKVLPAAWIDSKGTKWWHCQPCFDKKREKRYNYSGGSSTIVHHLRREHNIIIHGKEEVRRGRTQNRLGDITTFLAQETMHSNKKRKVTQEADALDQATIRELYCRYIVACSLPFSHIEQPAFIRYICHAADDILPMSGSTVKNDLQKGYEEKKEVSLVVRIKELEGQHSGENMAEAIMEFIREYGIASKVGYFMMDNATNMNTMIDKISDDLEHEFDVFYDPLPYRLRCVGYIICLAVMEFLLGKRPLTTVYITWTPQRLQTFTTLSDGLRLRRDNDTRWNSWYKMVEWALRPKIRQAVTIFCAQEPALQDDTLTQPDWLTLAEIHKFLEPFYDATVANEGIGDSISDVLPTMDYLLHHIEAAKTATTLPHLATMMETAWAKLADYYELTEDSPVYSAATVLNPSLKWAYMERTWEDKLEWIEKAKERVGQLWRETYKSTSSCPILRPSPPQDCTTKRLNGYKMWMKEQKSTIFNKDDDEYEVYCREPVMTVSDPLKWWLEPAQRRRFPNLSLMAIDILSIPPMSTETERLFSKAKLTVTDVRGSMNIDTLNLVECLRSWDRSALILPSDCCYVDQAGDHTIQDS
ncbi:Ribonuclease H-like protein, partial [Metarhizium hybridum]